jgi:signal transduction histidine kinase
LQEKRESDTGGPHRIAEIMDNLSHRPGKAFGFRSLFVIFFYLISSMSQLRIRESQDNRHVISQHDVDRTGAIRVTEWNMMTFSQFNRLPSLAIGQTLFALTAMFIVTLFGILLYTIITIQHQQLDSVTIDLAGRQRMLSQQHMKEILLLTQGVFAEYLVTRNILNQTLDALMLGGQAIISLDNGETVTLPPPPTPDILQALSEQKALMDEFTQKADVFLTFDADHPEYSAELDELLALNARLNDVANKAVRLFSRHSKKKISDMIIWESLIGLLAGIFGILMARQVRLANRELEHEIQERSRIETALRHRIEIEKLVTNLSTEFINLNTTHLDLEINRALATIGTFGDMDRSYVFVFEDDETTLNNTHEWCRPGVEPQQAHLQGIRLAEWPWFQEQLRFRPFIQISSVDNLPPEAALEKREFQRQHIKSLLNVPMVWQGTLFGFLGFDSVQKEKNWSDEDIGLLHMAGEIFVNGFERKRVEENLRKSEAEKVEAFRQSDALKTALLSLVSHELRTPLTAIKASVAGLNGLSAEGNPSIQKEFLIGINQEIDYLNGLIENLLDMSRVEAGALGIHREWHLLEDLLEGAIRRVEKTLKSRSLQVKLDDTISSIFVDGVAIQQVLINLLDNAIKYSPEGSLIRIVGHMLPGQVKVRISSEGEGIPQEDLALIFERFYRMKGPQARLIRGTGLGLAICKGIVEAHGGRIWAESPPSRGVTIGFMLPNPDAPFSMPLDQPKESPVH